MSVDIQGAFTAMMQNVTNKGADLQASIDKLSNGDEISDQDMLKLQFEVNMYNATLEMTSTISKALVDESKQLAQRSS